MEVTIPKVLFQKTVANRIVNAGGTTNTSTTKIRQREEETLNTTTFSIQKTKQKTSVVDAIVVKVDAEFRKRDEELMALSEMVREKEQEIKYCESETKKQIDSTSILSSSISYRAHATEKLKKSFDIFKNHAVFPLDNQFKFFCRKLNDCKFIYLFIFATAIYIYWLFLNLLKVESFVSHLKVDITMLGQAKIVLKGKFAFLEEEKVRFDSWMSEKEAQLASVHEQLANLVLQIFSHQIQISAANDSACAIQSESKTAQEELDGLQVCKAGLMREREELTRALTSLQERYSLKVAQAEVLEVEIRTHTESMTKEYAEVEQSVSVLRTQQQELESLVEGQDSRIIELTQSVESMSATQFQNDLDIEVLHRSNTDVYTALLKEYHNLRTERAYCIEQSSQLETLQTESQNTRDNSIKAFATMNQHNEKLSQLQAEAPKHREELQKLTLQLNENMASANIQAESDSAEVTQLEKQSNQIGIELKLLQKKVNAQMQMISDSQKETNLLSTNLLRCGENMATLREDKHRLSATLQDQYQQVQATEAARIEVQSVETVVSTSTQALEQMTVEVEQLQKTLAELEDNDNDANETVVWTPSPAVQHQIEVEVEKSLNKQSAKATRAFNEQNNKLEEDLSRLRQQKLQFETDEQDWKARLQTLKNEISTVEQHNGVNEANIEDLTAACHAIQKDNRRLAIELTKKEEVSPQPQSQPEVISAPAKSKPATTYSVSQVRYRELLNPGVQLKLSTTDRNAKGLVDIPPRSLSKDLPETVEEHIDDDDINDQLSDDDISPSKFLGKVHARDKFKVLPPPPMANSRPAIMLIPRKSSHREESSMSQMPPPQQTARVSDKPAQGVAEIHAPAAKIDSRAAEDTSDDSSYRTFFMDVDCTGGSKRLVTNKAPMQIPSKTPQPRTLSSQTYNQLSTTKDADDSKWPVTKPPTLFPGLEAATKVAPKRNDTINGAPDKKGGKCNTEPQSSRPEHAHWKSKGAASSDRRRMHEPTVYRSSTVTTKRVTHETAAATHTVSTLVSKCVSAPNQDDAWFVDDADFGFVFGKNK